MACTMAALLRHPGSGHVLTPEEGRTAYKQALRFFKGVNKDTMIEALRKLYREGEREARKRAAAVANLTTPHLH